MSDPAGADGRSTGPISHIIDLFLRTDAAPVLVLLSLIAGLVAMSVTPREEEPQIVVPMADVFLQAPGLTVREIERQVVTPLEKLLFQVPGVEHVYSSAERGRALVTVRFFVGEDREDSLLKLYDKLYSNTDQVPASVAGWVVKPREIDDVPIVMVSLWSAAPERYDDYPLRRIAEELAIELKALDRTNRVYVVGGRERVIRVELDAEALAGRQTAPLDVVRALRLSDVRQPTLGFDRRDRHLLLDVEGTIDDLATLERTVVNVVDGRPVFLADVGQVVDGPAERTSYTWLGFGPGGGTIELGRRQAPGSDRTGEATRGADPARAAVDAGADVRGERFPAVHVAVAKRRGTNAVWVADAVRERVAALAPTLLPDGVQWRITRDYGETANHKVNELLEALAVAIVIVIALIAYALGWREGLVVALAVPITFSLTLLVNWWAGYTINRVTLFALILALGLVVDDPIVDVENIYRHLRRRAEPPLDAVRTAVNEVRPPILWATAAIIVAFLPLTLITGMMGPYMGPMALNVPVAMLASLVVAFTMTPWLAYKALKGQVARADHAPAPPTGQTAMYRAYRWVMTPFLEHRHWAFALIAALLLAFCVAALLGVFRAVPLKMLPFDNKNEFQIVVNAPEGSTLERTEAAVHELTQVLAATNEVVDYAAFVGTASPMDFNGLVRHYYLRNRPHEADIRVNLVAKADRAMQSHEVLLRLRRDLESVAARHGVRLQLVEVPPGPPVLATVTAQIHGEPGVPYARVREAARIVAERLRRAPGVSDVDTTVETEAQRWVFRPDQEKAALSGVALEDIAETLRLALDGHDAALLHDEDEADPLPIRLRLPRALRSGEEGLKALAIKGQRDIVKQRQGGGLANAPVPVVRLGELGRLERAPIDGAILHKDLAPVAFVYAEAVGRSPAAVVTDIAADYALERGPGIAAGEAKPAAGRSYLFPGGGLVWGLPPGTSVDWLGEGELEITVKAFRDLGIAFGVALIGIYLILSFQTRSYVTPLILMIAIPLTLIGIMPGFWLLNWLTTGPIDGFADPVFFTATAMIGMIALAGIAVRNAILLIEFLHMALARGESLREAILQAGAVRTRAILLTAGTATLAAIPITFDPVFSGLAWALIFGLVVSTAFTLVVVPVVYDLVFRHTPGHGGPPAPEREKAS